MGQIAEPPPAWCLGRAPAARGRGAAERVEVVVGVDEAVVEEVCEVVECLVVPAPPARVVQHSVWVPRGYWVVRELDELAAGRFAAIDAGVPGPSSATTASTPAPMQATIRHRFGVM
jgi:hypothetical protein